MDLKFFVTYMDLLTDKMLNEIFKNVDVATLDDYTKSFYVYNYLVKTMKFDYELWEKMKSKQSVPSPFEQIVNNFLTNKGVCSTFAQIYLKALTKLKIPVIAVLGYDDGDIHQFNLVKRGENWSFDDATLGIICPEKQAEYFDYVDCSTKKQEVLGLMPNLYENEMSIVKNELHCHQSSNTGLYPLPQNLKKFKEANISSKNR